MMRILAALALLLYWPCAFLGGIARVCWQAAQSGWTAAGEFFKPLSRGTDEPDESEVKFCNATFPVEGSLTPYFCTERPGHRGAHKARLGGFGDVVMTWPNV